MMSRSSIKRVLAKSLSAVFVFTSILGSGITASASSTSSFASEFANPGQDARLMTRYWLPGGAVNADDVAIDIEDMRKQGFGGVEIVNLPTPSLTSTVDPVKYGWQSEAWVKAIEAVLTAAEENNMKADITIGPVWPATSPLITPNDDGASKQLDFGIKKINAGETYTGEVPGPGPSSNAAVTKQELIAVTVAKVTNFVETSGRTKSYTYTLDENSLQDITDLVNENNEITWTAPDGEEGEQWIILGFWMQGTGATVSATSGLLSDPQSYAVNHLSKAGAKAVTDFWDEYILGRSEIIRNHIKNYPTAFFEDSLEVKGSLLWTREMLDTFKELKDYDLTKYLPLLYKSVSDQGGTEQKGTYTFNIESTDKANRINRDYTEVRGQLYIENHLKPIRDWAKSQGFIFRAQTYNNPVDDSLEALSLTDIPEGESLEFGDGNFDGFRALAGAAHMSSKNIVSEELGANGSAFQQKWQDLVKYFNQSASVGVNRVILHGYSYPKLASDQWPGGQAKWPGFLAMLGWFNAEWNRYSSPSWNYMKNVADYIGRTQTVLQKGTQKVDVAIYQDKFAIKTGPFFKDQSLSNAGYTYDYLSPALLELESAKVSNGVLNADGPAYKALVVNGNVSESIELNAAEKILQFAKDGLPVVLLGNIPATVPGVDLAGDSAKIPEIMNELQALPNVYHVDSEADVKEALENLGVTPSVEYSESVAVHNVRRSDDGVEYYFIYNADTKTADMDITLTGSGQPYKLNAWTGEITPIAQYTVSDNKVTTHVKLAPQETTIIAVTESDMFGEKPEQHVISSQTDEVEYVNGSVIVSDSEAGTYEVALSDGKTINVSIPSVPDVIDLTSAEWKLDVESWTPAAEGVGEYGVNTDKTMISRELTGLVTWDQIDGLKDVSGVAEYTTTVTLGSDWERIKKAYLSLGTCDDVNEIVVNGNVLPPINQSTRVIDIGSYLKVGENTIKIKTSTTLLNAISKAGTTMARGSMKYGLVGPVTITPYYQVVLGDAFTVKTTFTVGETANATKLEANAMLDASAVIRNNDAESKQVLLIVALYDSDNRMVNVSYLAKEVAAGATENFHAGFKLPSDVTGYKAKAFVWEGESLTSTNMKPVSNVVEITD